ncbi:hypothetical protein MHUMG1_10603 [Metarhizium humberi]|uniref:Heterokaryon incompatibility domain-containing protein n=1 Tax=Metarhizium humberi TaxID=2596975 RepID=A0A9P8S2J5_9HYPO|nr:hypothetical protein MHUMG1_10603 [Metarhizium humberi]
MTDANKGDTRRRCIHIEKMLRTNRIGPHRALICATNEFRHWQPSDVEALFKLLPDLKERKLSPHGPESRHVPRGNRRWKELAIKMAVLGAVDAVAIVASPLALLSKTVRHEALPGLIRFNYESIGSSLFVKCPFHLLRQAAHTGMAVCVNRVGHFSLRNSGYAAISHVWAETMGLEFNNEKVDQDDRGIDYKHFGRIMSGAVASTGHEWFWLDLLAVPQIKGDEPDVQMLREMKTSVINSLIHVYRNADAVVILDSLTLQLSTLDPCAVAAILSCGRWLTRMWTYQEIKLARKALIVTRAGAVDFDEMVKALHVRKSHSDGAHKYWHEIHVKLMRLLPSDARGVSLADVAFCCGDRNAENDLDYAQSLFALLNLQWKTGWTYEEAMLHIITSRPQDAARIAMWSELPHSWSHELGQWLEQATPSGTARLLCAKVPENLHIDHHPVIMLMVLQRGAELLGTVVGTLAMNDDDITELDGERLQWLLT